MEQSAANEMEIKMNNKNSFCTFNAHFHRYGLCVGFFCVTKLSEMAFDIALHLKYWHYHHHQLVG